MSVEYEETIEGCASPFQTRCQTSTHEHGVWTEEEPFEEKHGAFYSSLGLCKAMFRCAERGKREKQSPIRPSNDKARRSSQSLLFLLSSCHVA